jgi:hypothetical protein
MACFLGLTIWGGYWEGLSLSLPFLDVLFMNEYLMYGMIAVVLAIVAFVHYRIRRWAAAKVSARLLSEVKDADLHPNYQRAFRKSSRWWRSLFWPNPAGWGKRTAARLEKVLDDSNAYIQKLNDEYTNPSGRENTTKAFDRQAPAEIARPDFTQGDSDNPLPDDTDPITSKN